MDDAAVRRRFERIEATLDGIAKSQASAETRMDRADARFEKRMKGFEQLVRFGMKELARQRKDTDERLNALIDSHHRTEAVLRRFMSSFPKGGGNGHSRSQN